MKVLETNRRVFTWMCAFPPKEGATMWEKIVCGIGFLSILVIVVSMLCATFAFFLNYMSTDLGQASFAIVEIVTTSVAFYIVFVSFLRQRKLFTIYEQLAKICNARKNTFELSAIFIDTKRKKLLTFCKFLDERQGGAQYLLEANKKCEKIWDITFMLVKWGTGNMILLGAFSVIIGKWFTGQYVSQYAFNAYKAW